MSNYLWTNGLRLDGGIWFGNVLPRYEIEFRAREVERVIPLIPDADD